MTVDRWAGMPPLQAQSEILTEMSRDMLESITGEWDHATYTIQDLGGGKSGRFEVFDGEGNSRMGMDRVTYDLGSDLKRVMFVAGRGSWITMRLTVHNGGQVGAEFDYDTRPEFRSKMLAVSGYLVALEQRNYPRDRAHQPQWCSVLLDEYLDAQQVRLDTVAARDQAWAGIGQASAASNSSRLVILPDGTGLLVTDGYSDPSPQHPGDPGFELYLPSVLFTGDIEQARQAWPFKHLNYLVGTTTDQDIDWPAWTADGPVPALYLPNYANDTPQDWRDPDDDQCGMLVGVPFPGVPDSLAGPAGPIRLIGVLPARPSEWAVLADGDPAVRHQLAARLAALDPHTLAAPDRPAVA